MGAPQTGKSGALRALIAGAALTHTPADVAFYCLDLGGGGLATLAGLPHVGGVAGRLDPDRVRRTVAEVAGQLGEREQLFATERLDSVEAMRATHRAGRLPQLPVADIFLVIDNWVVFKEDFEDLTDVVPEPYLGGYAGTAPVATGLAAGLAGEELKRRLPPDDVTSAQLRERSWWKGPEIVVLADDFDLLSPAGPGPLAPLLEYLPQSRDLGLHLVLLRRSGGASRAVHEPVIGRLKENGATGLLLSGDRQEGQLWPGAYLSVQPPGRGLLIRRGRRPLRLQLAHLPEQ